MEPGARRLARPMTITREFTRHSGASLSVAGTIVYQNQGTNRLAARRYSAPISESPTISFGDPTLDLCEIVIYGTALTQDQLDAEVARLKTKWGLPDTL